MASLVLSGDTSGSITVSAPAVSGSNTQTLAAVTGTLAPIVSGTAVSASGTSVDFTNIPLWVKRITVMLSGVSTNGTSLPQIQLGDSGGIETTGYICFSGLIAGASVVGASYTSGFVSNLNNASNNLSGSCVITLLGSNTWTATLMAGSPGSTAMSFASGSKTLSDTLTQVRITTAGGVDTFDAGTINILYEG